MNRIIKSPNHRINESHNHQISKNITDSQVGNTDLVDRIIHLRQTFYSHVLWLRQIMKITE